MSGRDLLYKPQAPVVVPDDDELKAKRVGVKGPRGRALGGVGEIYETKAPAHIPEAPPEGGQTQARSKRGPAYKNAYFNKDVSSVLQPNLRQSDMQALRGEMGVTDLKRVVLPRSEMGVETPTPSVLLEAGELMGIVDGFRHDLRTLLARQGQWARGEGVTPELLQRRIARFEQMIEDRRVALQRMKKLEQGRLGQSVTLNHAVTSDGQALETAEDVASEGAELIEKTAEGAQGMHRRLAKVLGVKSR